MLLGPLITEQDYKLRLFIEENLDSNKDLHHT